jgi:hypothetical protein
MASFKVNRCSKANACAPRKTLTNCSAGKTDSKSRAIAPKYFIAYPLLTFAFGERKGRLNRRPLKTLRILDALIHLPTTGSKGNRSRTCRNLHSKGSRNPRSSK